MFDSSGNEVTLSTHIGNLNPFRYRSYYYDTETKLYYLKTRYYDPEVGRFINMDSIRYAAPETINGLNLYAYCGNNPVMYTDSIGTSKWSNFWSNAGRLIGGFTLARVGAAITISSMPLALASPVAPAVTEFGLTVGMYGAFTVGSVFDSQIKADIDAIGWNPYNKDPALVDPSSTTAKVSFYKGVPIIRTNSRSGTFGIMFLEHATDEATVKHEFGHIPQLMMLGGANFLLTVGLPSAQEWGKGKYWESGYSAPWESMAEMFGGAGSVKLSASEKKRAKKYLIASYFLGPLVHSFYYLL